MDKGRPTLTLLTRRRLKNIYYSWRYDDRQQSCFSLGSRSTITTGRERVAFKSRAARKKGTSKSVINYKSGSIRPTLTTHGNYPVNPPTRTPPTQKTTLKNMADKLRGNIMYGFVATDSKRRATSTLPLDSLNIYRDGPRRREGGR